MQYAVISFIAGFDKCDHRVAFFMSIDDAKLHKSQEEEKPFVTDCKIYQLITEE